MVGHQAWLTPMSTGVRTETWHSYDPSSLHFVNLTGDVRCEPGLWSTLSLGELVSQINSQGRPPWDCHFFIAPSLPGTPCSQRLASGGSSELHLCSIIARLTSILLIISVCLHTQLHWRLVSTTYHLTLLCVFFLLLLGMWLVRAHPSRLITRGAQSFILQHCAFLPPVLGIAK